MFLFTPNQISTIKDSIRRETLLFILKNVGLYGLTSDDIKFIKDSGIDFPKVENEWPIIKAAFQFGQWSNNTSPQFAKNINFDDFMKVIKSNKFLPPTKEDQYALDNIEYDTTRDIKTLGNRLGNKLDVIISEKDSMMKPKYIKIIGDKTKEAILKRQTVKELASELYHGTGDVTRDLIRVAQYQLHSSLNLGRFGEIKRIYGETAQVYFYVYPEACKHCTDLYLTNGFGSKPKTFTFDELEGNGTNIGRKVKDWKPTITSTHPYCRCTLEVLPKYEEWDETEGKFIMKQIENVREKIKEFEANLIAKRAQRASDNIKKGELSNDLVKQVNQKHGHNELILSHYKAVNEYEKLFKQNLANSLGKALEESIKVMMKFM